MILHKLIKHHLKFGPDALFYKMQSDDAISWMRNQSVEISERTKILDLGCGTGVFGKSLFDAGSDVVFSDYNNWLIDELQDCDFRQIDIDNEDLARLGQYDLVVCSNVLEHLKNPKKLISEIDRVLVDGGVCYLSWTNWLSPWGGHDFSPFHYLGPKLGTWLFDKLVGKKRLLNPYENLYPTFIGNTLRDIKRIEGLKIEAVVPRYYTEFAFLMKIPILREYFAWNCAILIRKIGN